MTSPFASLADFRALLADLPGPDAAAQAAAAARNGQLTKPPGALGRLEDLAIWFAGWQGTDRPRCDRPQVVIFAGNHGVVAQGVSAFPAEVTVQMVANFRAGGGRIISEPIFGRHGMHAIALTGPRGFHAGPAMTGAEVVAACHRLGRGICAMFSDGPRWDRQLPRPGVLAPPVRAIGGLWWAWHGWMRRGWRASLGGGRVARMPRCWGSA